MDIADVHTTMATAALVCEVAMYMQGIWALNPIKQANPDIEAGIFPYPVSDNPDDRVLVSGVDVAVMIGRDTPHMEEAKRFVDYLYRPDVIEEFKQVAEHDPGCHLRQVE